MARHLGTSLSFEFPRDWVDCTVVRYEAPRRAGIDGERSPGSVTLSHANFGDAVSIEQHVERALEQLAAREGFVLREVSPASVEGRPARLARYATVEGGTPYEHRALFVPYPERKVAVLTLSAPRLELAQVEPLFDRMLASARLT